MSEYVKTSIKPHETELFYDPTVAAVLSREGIRSLYTQLLAHPEAKGEKLFGRKRVDLRRAYIDMVDPSQTAGSRTKDTALLDSSTWGVYQIGHLGGQERN
jgi:hypothetical protein